MLFVIFGGPSSGAPSGAPRRAPVFKTIEASAPRLAPKLNSGSRFNFEPWRALPGLRALDHKKHAFCAADPVTKSMLFVGGRKRPVTKSMLFVPPPSWPQNYFTIALALGTQRAMLSLVGGDADGQPGK
jgi:hypothetical protein